MGRCTFLLSLYFLLFLHGSVICDGPGEPLFISKYLPDNPAVARKLSQVNGLGNFTSYSGFITVNETTFSNMFFWFFPAQNQDPNAPVLVWLQGGPGGSSLFGLFTENGPFSVSPDGQSLIAQPYTWNTKYSLIFIDNPVGTGFSFTSSNDGFSTNEVQVGANLYSVLTQFFQVFPDFSNNDFYVTGESYAGKYVPALAYTIHTRNPSAPKKINLKGIAIGDGMMDPLTQTQGISDLAYFFSMADSNERKVIKQYEDKIKAAILAEQYEIAFYLFDEMINGDFYPYPTYFANITGTTNYFNFLDPVYAPNPYPQFLNLTDTRSKIHVGSVPFFDYNATVERNLIHDWMTSVKTWVEVLLDNYKVLLYNGQNDVILSAPVAEAYMLQLNWTGSDEYRAAPKLVWKVDKNDMFPAGYAREVKNFRQVVVRDAGHMVPADQPRRAFDMIDRFIQGKSFGKP
eukprot:TRINITY_DN1296_c0_g1_i1.p1 TRINITY_DN1296_c0_g1~~TRINITY_DN1296_c0_g1_i1.p1  ORF type:complete len:482 (-),score=105.44 TRINITY_DN1296_c0_g1_i1:24-1397(-)